MGWEIYETSNPYLSNISIDDNNLIIEMGVDQLWIDPDTNEQKVIEEYWNYVSSLDDKVAK